MAEPDESVLGAFWSALLLGIATSMDNFIIGLTYGARGNLFTHWQNLIIASLNAAGTMVSMGAGEITRFFIPEYVAKYLAGLLFVFLGVDTLRQTFVASFGGKKHSSKSFDEIEVGIPLQDGSELESPSLLHSCKKKRTYSETFSIALGLTFSNLAGGVGAGLADLDVVLVTILALLTNFALLDIGERIGVSIRGTLPTTPIFVGSGSVLIIMGLAQFLLP